MIKTNALFDFLKLVSENEASMLYINQAQEHERKGMFGDAERLYLTVSEIGLYYTCWWYSLCNFQYRQHYEQTCSYNFDC